MRSYSQKPRDSGIRLVAGELVRWPFPRSVRTGHPLGERTALKLSRSLFRKFSETWNSVGLVHLSQTDCWPVDFDRGGKASVSLPALHSHHATPKKLESTNSRSYSIPGFLEP